jgi:hypothetical protein
MAREQEMNTSAFKYSVRLPFVARPVNPEWLGSKFLATLDTLTQIDPTVFPDWEVSDLPAMRGYPLAMARSRIADIIGNNVTPYDRDLPKTEDRYTAVAHTTIGTRSRRMTVWVRPWLGEVSLKAGDEMVAPDPAIVTFSLFRAALCAINAIWQQPWACVQAFRLHYDQVPLYSGAELFPYSRFHIPWIGYLSSSTLSGATVRPDIKMEHISDGGLLMTAAEDRLDPTDPEHLRHARILAETMIAFTGYQPRGMTRG